MVGLSSWRWFVNEMAKESMEAQRGTINKATIGGCSS